MLMEEKGKKERTRSGERGQPGSSQDCHLHTCKRKKGNNHEEDKDEKKIKKKKVYTLREKMDKKKRHMGKELHRTGKRNSRK